VYVVLGVVQFSVEMVQHWIIFDIILIQLINALDRILFGTTAWIAFAVRISLKVSLSETSHRQTISDCPEKGVS
jgi:hypothetical protein